MSETNLRYSKSGLYKTIHSQYFMAYCQQSQRGWIISKIINPPTDLAKCDPQFNYTPNDWSWIFRMPFCTVPEAKVKYFQFRFLSIVL